MKEAPDDTFESIGSKKFPPLCFHNGQNVTDILRQSSDEVVQLNLRQTFSNKVNYVAEAVDNNSESISNDKEAVDNDVEV